MAPPLSLLLIPLAMGLAEFADIQASRHMSALGVMLAYRSIALAFVVPASWALPASALTGPGIMWCAYGALVITISTPVWLAAARTTDGATLAALSSASPVVVGALAWGWRGEVPRPLHMVCMLGMMVCAWGLTR